MSDRPTVAVIGAGFSGLLTALRLLLAPEGPRVVLIEKGPRFGRGAAYSTASPHHLLNVRATNMSALVTAQKAEGIGSWRSPYPGSSTSDATTASNYLGSLDGGTIPFIRKYTDV